jgi:hypothetical protein
MLATPTGDGGVGGRVQQRGGLAGALQPHVHPLQQVGLVENRLDDVDLVGMPGARQAAVRCDGLDGAVERVVAGAGLEELGLELRLPAAQSGMVL